MQKLPVIIGFGGINPAGRSSFHHSYRRMVHEALNEEQLSPMFKGLANLMGKDPEGDRQELLDHTLIRKIEPQYFDVNHVKIHKKTTLQIDDDVIKFKTTKRQLPSNIPDNWTVKDLGGGKVEVIVNGDMPVMTHDTFALAVTSAGQVPTGFNPGEFYRSSNQPRGLQLAVFGAADALNSLGIDWQIILDKINPDEVAVYAASAIGQLDDFGGKGLHQAMLKGGRVTSKQTPLMLSQMPADFINSYIIDSVGSTGANIGACATFLYNLRQGIGDIQAGRAKVVIVGAAEAPIEPELIEGFKAMGALAEDSQLAALDNSKEADNRKALRPFAENAGFTMAEGSQFFILMDDELALELGANIYGSVPDVFVNSDANKKSISSPGIGNYITVAKTMALAKNILGEEGIKQSFVLAHGTGTPQNRVTESHILNEIAKTFEIENWSVSAIKSYIGHTMGPAGGDQLAASLGVWEYGYLPAINTIDKIADDVFDSNLEFCLQHKNVGKNGCEMKAAVLNSKGFGGNNASALVLSPQVTMEMLQKKHGVDKMKQYQQKNVAVKATAKAYDENAINGDYNIIYNFGTNVMDSDDLKITKEGIQLSQFKNQIHFSTENPYSDYC